MVVYERLTKENFGPESLDSFCRHQQVSQCWRWVEGEWRLLPIAFVEDWDLEQRRAHARSIAENLGGSLVGWAAFEEGRVVGYATVATAPFGSENQYLQLDEFQVSEPCRGRGIGRELFGLACQGARELHGRKLYISAHSSQESQAAYRALGCVHAREINQQLAQAEPCDLQLEFCL